MDLEITDLTRGLANCDESAWHCFHERYFATLRGRAISRGTAESEAAEVVQGVYLRVMRHAKVFRESAAFEAWLACLTRCEVIDLARKSRRRSWLGECFQHWQEGRQTVPDDETGDRLREAVGELEEPGRTLVTRHYIEGWTQEELAVASGITVKAVESKLARLRCQLRRSLKNPDPY